MDLMGGPASQPAVSRPSAVILGTAQDGGYPQAGCRSPCCRNLNAGSAEALHPACLAICEPATGSRWMIDCTPHFPRQLTLLDSICPGDIPSFLLTHAHTGHYTGLTHLGNEVMGSCEVDVFVLPLMKSFLENNLPWSELADRGNIILRPAFEGEPIELGSGLRVTPRLVPHRDEHSETACYRVDGPGSSILWLPDIDGWEGMSPPIEELIGEVDRAFLDGSFFSPGELPGRVMSSISHPLIQESIELFSGLDEETRRKISFIHLNHSNPAIDPRGDAARAVRLAGHSIARQGHQIEL